MMIFIKTGVCLQSWGTHIYCECRWGEQKNLTLDGDALQTNALLFITFYFAFYSRAYYVLHPGIPSPSLANSPPPASVLLFLSLNPSFLYFFISLRLSEHPLPSVLRARRSYFIRFLHDHQLYLANILPGISPPLLYHLQQRATRTM